MTASGIDATGAWFPEPAGRGAVRPRPVGPALFHLLHCAHVTTVDGALRNGVGTGQGVPTGLWGRVGNAAVGRLLLLLELRRVGGVWRTTVAAIRRQEMVCLCGKSIELILLGLMMQLVWLLMWLLLVVVELVGLEGGLEWSS